jgi:uncharacterized protein YegJ (DUF2314 family)
MSIMRRLSFLLVAGLLLALPACGGGGASTPAASSAKGKSMPDRDVYVSEHDPGMAAAKQQAQDHWNNFVASFREHRAGLDHEVNVTFRAADGTITSGWADVEALDDHSVTGTMASDLPDVGAPYGKKITVNRGRVADWVIARGRTIVDGFYSYDAVMGLYGN